MQETVLFGIDNNIQFNNNYTQVGCLLPSFVDEKIKQTNIVEKIKQTKTNFNLRYYISYHDVVRKNMIKVRRI